MRKLMLAGFVLLLALGPKLSAQDQAQARDAQAAESSKAVESPTHYYHLDFVIQELGADAKPVNSRSFSTTVSTGSATQNASIRTGSRIPIATELAGANTQFQYIDIGINLDIQNAREIGSQLMLKVVAEVSRSSSLDPTLHQPIIRHNSWNAPVLIPIGKPTIAFSSDELDTKGSMQIVVTAKRIQ